MQKVKNLFGEEVGERFMLGIVRSDEIRYKDATVGESFEAALQHLEPRLPDGDGHRQDDPASHSGK